MELKNQIRAFMTREDYCEHHKRYDASDKGKTRNKRFWASKAGKASRLRDKEKVLCECGMMIVRRNRPQQFQRIAVRSRGTPR